MMASPDARSSPPPEGTVRLVDELIGKALACGASDVHFEPTDVCLLVRARVDGQLRDFEELPLTITENVVARLKVMAGLLTYRIDIPQEGSLRWPPGADVVPADQTDLRVAAFPTIRGERVVIRVFRARGPVEALDQLGLPAEQVDAFRAATRLPAGMVIITGPAGSGKTTTLYAMLRHMQETTPDRSLITLEDPVEQRIDRVTQIQINPYGELSYERCLRSLLRQDPQVILLGEIRDAATAGIAVEASLTGHLILTTMHSGDPAEAIVRLLEMKIAAYQVVSSVAVVCSQRLLRRLCETCGARAGQCECCYGTGYAGRMACAQFVQIDETVRAAILEHTSAPRLRRVIAEQGPDLYGRAQALAEAGVTNADEVRRVLGDPPDASEKG